MKYVIYITKYYRKTELHNIRKSLSTPHDEVMCILVISMLQLHTLSEEREKQSTHYITLSLLAIFTHQHLYLSEIHIKNPTILFEIHSQSDGKIVLLLRKFHSTDETG